MKKLLKRFWSDEEGATMIEYGVIAGVISVAGIAAIILIGPKLSTMWNALEALIP